MFFNMSKYVYVVNGAFNKPCAVFTSKVKAEKYVDKLVWCRRVNGFSAFDFKITRLLLE